MESTDREILLDIHGRLVTIEQEQARQAQELKAVRAEMRDIREEQRVLRVQADSLQTSVYWVLAAIGIFLAGLALPCIIASFKKNKPVEYEPSLSPSEIIRIVNETLNLRLQGGSK